MCTPFTPGTPRSLNTAMSVVWFFTWPCASFSSEFEKNRGATPATLRTRSGLVCDHSPSTSGPVPPRVEVDHRHHVLGPRVTGHECFRAGSGLSSTPLSRRSRGCHNGLLTPGRGPSRAAPPRRCPRHPPRPHRHAVVIGARRHRVVSVAGGPRADHHVRERGRSSTVVTCICTSNPKSASFAATYSRTSAYSNVPGGWASRAIVTRCCHARPRRTRSPVRPWRRDRDHESRTRRRRTRRRSRPTSQVPTPTADAPRPRTSHDHRMPDRRDRP